MVICVGDKWSLKEEMTCGAPQGSQVGPLVWNVMYVDFLRMDLPAGTSIIGFADDALVVCAADDVRILELRINESLWRAKRWLDSRCLNMDPEKTEALLVRKLIRTMKKLNIAIFSTRSKFFTNLFSGLSKKSFKRSEISFLNFVA